MPLTFETTRSAAADRERVAQIAEACELPIQFHHVTAPAEVRRARVLERNEVRGETFAFAVTPDMFDFVEWVYEAPGPDELAGCIISESA